MKKTLLFVFLLFTVIALGQDYKKEWAKVIENEAEGEVKQAASLADIIYLKAKKDNNQPEIIKAFFFKAKYTQVIEEDAQFKIITEIQASIKNAQFPSKNILKSIYADMLGVIHDRNAYRIRSVTNIQQNQGDDYRQWSLQNFKTEINRLYNESLDNREALYNIPLSDFDAIIDFAPSLRDSKRSLYDFLAECYLDNLAKNTDSRYNTYWNKKTDKLFGTSEEFLKISPNDSLPYAAKTALKLMAEIEKHYIKDNDQANLDRATLRRLGYLTTGIAYNDKKEAYLATVTKIAINKNKTPFTFKAKLIQAQLLTDQANKINYKHNLVQAVALYDEIIKNKEQNDVSANAINLKNTITSRTAAITTQSFIAPNSPSLASVNFRNLDSITIRFYKTPYSAEIQENDFQEKYISNKKPFLQKTYLLPNKHDYFVYSTEIILPQLPQGNYALAISPAGEDLNFENNLSLTKITVSQISIISDEMNGDINYQVVNHFTGKPVENVSVYITKHPQVKTDYNGKVNVRFNKYSNDNYVTFIHQSDTLSYRHYEGYYERDEDNWIASAHIYLDRPIYRPGQTVYFKVIAKQDKKGINSIIANTFFTVIVENGRSDEIKKFRLKTNEFGSFADKIELPKNMTGEFAISVEEDEEDELSDYNEVFWDEVSFKTSRTSFNVEEYKRPKFEIIFDNVKDNVHLNSTVTVKGAAKSFSSAAISGAEVTYRVKRNSRRYWYENYDGKDEEINEGKTTTDANGDFSVQFKAEPDDSFDPQELPVFSYTVYADVTDINGETHSNEFIVKTGYHTITVSAAIESIIYTNEQASVELITNNLNGQFTPAKGTLTIYKVSSPERFFTKRPWNEPEIQTIREDQFKLIFPYLPYKKVQDSVIRTNPVLTETVDTNLKKEIFLNGLKNWKSGSYELIFTVKDSLGNEISTKRRFTLKNDNDKVPADNEFFEYKIKNTDYTDDGYVEIELSTGLPLSLNVMASLDNKKIYDSQYNVNAEKKTIRIPVLQNPRTTMNFLISYIWQNEYYSESFNVVVPRKTEILRIETQTLSNKLTPGNNETWSFSIKGSKNPSEVLATMYDTSLDRLIDDNYYMSNSWDDLGLNSYRGGNIYRSLITSRNSSVYFSESLKAAMLSKNNDSFYKYGFDFDNTTNSYFAYAPKSQLRKKDDFIINGTVTDSQGFPVPGVNIVVNGTNEGTLTDIDGKYSLYASKDTKIVFTSIGSEIEYRTITSGGFLNVTLKDDAKILGDVVVEGYRSTSRATSNIAVTAISSKTIEGRPNANFVQTLQGQVPGINIATGAGQPGTSSTVILRGLSSINGNPQPLYVIDGVPLSEEEFKNLDPADIADFTVLKDAGATAIYGSRGANGVIIINTKTAAKEIEKLQQVKARKNFDETAFFHPQLRTDKHGNISFSFTTPEALTEWKLRMLAHNKKAASGYYENIFFTQKDLMIVPNMPRFLREKDTIVLIAKVTNLTAEVKTGNALLQLFDARTMEPADKQMLNIQNLQPFTIPAKGNATVSWKIAVPKGMQGVQYKVLAKAGDFSDGEENILPVLTNAVMVTESIPLWVKPNSVKEYSFKGFEESFSNKNISQIGITLEYTSNPTWLALQSLPYLMEFEHECAEQVFSRYYANAIASHVLENNKPIADVFAAWRKADKPLSKFEQNETLKSITMAETPWILDNQSSEEIKNRLALLMDLDTMEASLETSFKKLENKQLPSGGFPWFEGGKESAAITRHIAAGFGHLTKMGIALTDKKSVDNMTKRIVAFMDTDFADSHTYRKGNSKRFTPELISYYGLDYLYSRSFYTEQYPLPDSLRKVVNTYVEGLTKSTAYFKSKWMGYSLNEKAQTALVLNRFGYKEAAKKVINNLKETSSTNEEWGMYWIENKTGWRWHQAPVETQALLIEAFTEVDSDIASADDMKVWLLKNKQNKNWPTTKSTAEAVYALLMKGTNWISVKDNTTFKLGEPKMLTEKIAQTEKEAGTGYIKLQFTPDEIKPDMGNLTVGNKSAVPGFGGFYWQRSYENIEDYSSQSGGVLSITKELYSKANTAKGLELKAITKEKPLKIGDLVTVRLIINAKEDMEFLHLKDMRASAFEPVDVISEHKYNNGTSYYQSTRDAATHFFFDSLNKGVYVIEYDVRVNNAGDFSNGIATIQSMYAPEFSGNSKSMRVRVE